MSSLNDKLRAPRVAQLPTHARKSSAIWPTKLVPMPPEAFAIIARVHGTSDRRILRLQDTSKKTGRAPSTLWRDVKNGMFVPPIRIGERAVGWLEAEVDAVLEAQTISARSGNPIDIKRFVSLLIAANTKTVEGLI